MWTATVLWSFNVALESKRKKKKMLIGEKEEKTPVFNEFAASVKFSTTYELDVKCSQAHRLGVKDSIFSFVYDSGFKSSHGGPITGRRQGLVNKRWCVTRSTTEEYVYRYTAHEHLLLLPFYLKKRKENETMLVRYKLHACTCMGW